MIPHTRRTVAIVAIVALLTASVAPMSAAAQSSNDGPVDSLLDTGADGDTGLIDVASILAYARGLGSRARATVARPFSDRPDAETIGDDLQEFYNANNASFETYANSRVDASTDYDVIRVEIINGDTKDTVYLVSTVNGSDFEDSSVVDSTDRTVDEWVSLCGDAAADAPDRLEQFHDRFVVDDKDVNQSYLAEMRGRYGTDVRTSLLDHEDGCDA